MSYYMGDYYRGGFFGSLFRGVVGLGKGLLGIGGGTKTIIQQPAGGPAGINSAISSTVTNAIRGGKQIMAKHPVLSAAAAAGALAAAGGGAALARRGKHPAMVAAGRGGQRRRMHVTNVRALRRAIRRTHGFAKLAMKVIRLEHPRHKGKFAGFRKRKRSRV